MSDFGSDVGNSALSLTQKLSEAMLKLFERIFGEIAKRFSAEYKLKKIQLHDARTRAEKDKILSELPSKKGIYNYNRLTKAGVPLSFTGVKMSREDMQAFSNRMEREGMIFAGVKYKKDHSLGFKEPRMYEIVVQSKDLERVAELIETINDEKTINVIDSKIEEILEKGEESITEQDRVDLDSFKQQKEAIQRKFCDNLNQEQTVHITEKAVYGDSQRGMSFSRALDRNTGRSLDKDVFCIVADAKDPTKYIRCHGYMDEYKGNQYIKTDYEVFHGSQKVYQTHDGRFDDRPKDYWIIEKNKMQEIGGFGDTLFKFYDYTEYQKWAEEVKEQNDRELSVMDKTSAEKDYDELISSLESQLDENGAYYKDGAVFDKETDKAITLNDEMSEEVKALNSEAVIIGKQINNYKELKNIDSELTVAQVELATAQEGSKDKTTAQVKYEQIKTKYESVVSVEKELIEQRKNINAVQAEQIRKNAEKDIVLDKDLTVKDDKFVKMNDVKKAVKNRRENGEKTSFAKNNPSKNKEISSNVKER